MKRNDFFKTLVLTIAGVFGYKAKADNNEINIIPASGTAYVYSDWIDYEPMLLPRTVFETPITCENGDELTFYCSMNMDGSNVEIEHIITTKRDGTIITEHLC